MGIGNPNTYEAWAWYRKAFGVDVPVFDEAAVAGLMLPYTGGEPRERHAVLALNMQGGGGFEIWQYTERKCEKAAFVVSPGDLGITVAKIKARDVSKAHAYFVAGNFEVTALLKNPAGEPHFFVRDLNENWWQIEPSNDWFSAGSHVTGGLFGATIGVSDIDNARRLYSDILGYDRVVYDKEGEFDDLAAIPGGQAKFRRVMLEHSVARKGPFSEMLGATRIELIQALDRTPRKVFEGRFWGDNGFIHLCFDIQGMNEMREKCEAAGFPFTVDSAKSFDMGEAAGHFTYIEDPDGTLIEFVETHKVPIVKAIGFYLDLRKRNPERRLPRWMLKAMGLRRKKD